MTEMLEFDFTEALAAPPAGNPDRFTARWHFVGAGLSNVWRYGDLDLPTPTGRVLLRGPNGTGKTTALEALWPYLLDLDAAKLVAGKARTTTLKQLMSEGAAKTGRRYGYAWLTFAPPAGANEPDLVTYGVRLQYSPSSSPAVKVVPFTVPGRPLHDLHLRGANGAALEHDDFTDRVTDLGGDVFETTDNYVEHLALRVWSATAQQVKDIAQRMRQVRNPANLGELSPAGAAEALRDSLPGVDPAVITATADALTESEATREAFARDRQAAEALDDFNRVWSGHVVEVANEHLANAEQAAAEVAKLNRALSRAENDAKSTSDTADKSQQVAADLETRHKSKADEVAAIEQSEAYQTAGSIKELEARLAAERQNAASASASLTTAADAAAQHTEATRIALDGVADRLVSVLADAEALDAAVPPAQTLLAHHFRPRQVRGVGDVTANPGSGLTVTHNSEALDQLAVDWVAGAKALRSESGTAQALVKAHGEVDRASGARTKATATLERSEEQYRTEQQALTTLTGRARDAAASLLEAVAPWLQQHHELRAVDPSDPAAGYVWDTDDVIALAGAEPSAVLASMSDWAGHALTTAERLAAGHEAAATSHQARADELTQQAGELRARAQELRDGELLPFPRPEWAGPGGDAAAFGSTLEWQPGLDEDVRNRIEVALSASGLLTAHLDTDQVSTAVWRVSAIGPQVDGNLTQVLTVDPGHDAADAASAVLSRVYLAGTASAGGTGLIIGYDGTFSAGVLAGDPVAAALTATGAVPTAGFVGARTRRERALAEAVRLDTQAIDLDVRAAAARTQADNDRTAAHTVRAAGKSFPDRRPLDKAEAARSGTALRTQQAKVRRDEDEVKAATAAAEYQRVYDEWSTRARDLGLPADLEQLTGIVTDRRTRATGLDRAVTALRAVTSAIPRTLALLVDEAGLATRLAGLEDEARQALEKAKTTAALLEEVRRDSDAADAVRRHQEATTERDRLARELKPAGEKAEQDRRQAIEAQAKVEPARQLLTAALPAQAETGRLLSALLSWPPAAAALDVPGILTAADRDQEQGPRRSKQLLESAGALLAGKATSARRTLADRYDQARAELAQTWTLAHDDAPDGLNVEMYVLTHADEVYDPPRAARHAADLAERAQSALADAEAQALQDFVVGRLPSAIGTAWIQMHDWKNEVNAKMRSAQASSGVGVQVRITLRDDLDVASRTVYDLSCEVGNAVRTDDQKQQVGAAITALLAAADGGTMPDRLAAAVDIRAWVNLRYVVERPGDDGQRTAKVWGSRTGLSGGERRLVVLAPMLAAIAAGYDRLGASGLRLVPLDEVPAEVDERGREGLARYMAELDLDLVCTSYLWDGAPGAWDGIDGYDLEAGGDGTVVAFPTLVRGLELIPGDVIDVPGASRI